MNYTTTRDYKLIMTICPKFLFTIFNGHLQFRQIMLVFLMYNVFLSTSSRGYPRKRQLSR